MYLYVVLICTSLITNVIGLLFLNLFTKNVSSSVNFLFTSFTYFLCCLFLYKYRSYLYSLNSKFLCCRFFLPICSLWFQFLYEQLYDRVFVIKAEVYWQVSVKVFAFLINGKDWLLCLSLSPSLNMDMILRATVAILWSWRKGQED